MHVRSSDKKSNSVNNAYYCTVCFKTEPPSDEKFRHMQLGFDFVCFMYISDNVMSSDMFV